MVKELDYDIVVSKLEFQSFYDVHIRINILGKGMDPLFLPAIDLIVPIQFFNRDDFGIKYPTNFGMSLNKETNQPNQLLL